VTPTERGPDTVVTPDDLPPAVVLPAPATREQFVQRPALAMHVGAGVDWPVAGHRLLRAHVQQRAQQVAGYRESAVLAHPRQAEVGHPQLAMLVCVRADTGRFLWRKDYAKDLGGSRGGFGWCDQLCFDGGTLVCVPGGKSATVCGLKAASGEVA
jgi:hypothetical protein